MKSFSFGGSQHERIEIRVVQYERLPVGEFFDDHWLTVQVHVSVGKFCAQTDAAIITTELTEFLTQLRRVSKTLTGSAEFKTIEEQIELRLTGFGLGQIELRGFVSDCAGRQGNSLRFGFDIDQSYLRNSILELEDVIAEFPERN